jgi:phosphatidylserine decarboxylase
MYDDENRPPAPWLTAGFDWEGIVAAAAAFLVALLLGWIWAPLFWIGFAAVVLALLASRWSRRSPPEMVDGILAPCDGVIVSVSEGEAPFDVQMDEMRVTRVRIASAPSATNKLYSPINGGVEQMQVERGDASVPFATTPEEQGLATASLVFGSQGQQVGMRLATGGLGPRLEFDVSVGDAVRLGRIFGTRRLGGWCDLYLPHNAAASVWPGQTIIGGETVLARFAPDIAEAEFEETAAEVFEAPETIETEPDDETALLFQAEPEDEDYPFPDEVDTSDDPAVIFARIREAARKHGESD